MCTPCTRCGQNNTNTFTIQKTQLRRLNDTKLDCVFIVQMLFLLDVVIAAHLSNNEGKSCNLLKHPDRQISQHNALQLPSLAVLPTRWAISHHANGENQILIVIINHEITHSVSSQPVWS